MLPNNSKYRYGYQFLNQPLCLQKDEPTKMPTKMPTEGSASRFASKGRSCTTMTIKTNSHYLLALLKTRCHQPTKMTTSYFVASYYSLGRAYLLAFFAKLKTHSIHIHELISLFSRYANQQDVNQDRLHSL